MWPGECDSFDCVLALPQRTCSFGGFDLSNRSLHVVNAGNEANVSGNKTEEHELNSPATLNRADFPFVFVISLGPSRTLCNL